MTAAYDNYDYPSYWKERIYEHESEITAIKKFLIKIPKIKTTLDMGSGYGRLVPAYNFRTKKITLADPSAKLLSFARKNYKNSKKIEYLQTSIENISKRLKSKKFDLVLMVRVLHHINDVDKAFNIINKILNKNGYFILEFANKSNLKATARHFLGGDLTYPMEISPVDIRSKFHIRKKTLPFINYHPDQIFEKLRKSDFEIIETLSVSNIRSSFIKRMFPLEFLIEVEELLQKPLSYIKFGPSVFVLAKKGD